VREVTSRMPATVDATTDAEREPDNETPAEKSAFTLNYEAMLAALNGLLAEMHEERRHRPIYTPLRSTPSVYTLDRAAYIFRFFRPARPPPPRYARRASGWRSSNGQYWAKAAAARRVAGSLCKPYRGALAAIRKSINRHVAREVSTY
jgi:hypothetical protein